MQSPYICLMIKKFISYITFWKKPDVNAPTSFNLRVMHGINRISILIFLVAIIVIVVRLIKAFL